MGYFSSTISFVDFHKDYYCWQSVLELLYPVAPGSCPTAPSWYPGVPPSGPRNPKLPLTSANAPWTAPQADACDPSPEPAANAGIASEPSIIAVAAPANASFLIVIYLFTSFFYAIISFQD
jgi:hypothetical protein